MVIPSNKPPYFPGAPFTFTVLETTAPLAPLNLSGLVGYGAVVAADRNTSDTFTYSITAGSSLFTVNRLTGAVAVGATANFNYFAQAGYWFNVTVTDAFNFSVTTNVSVQVVVVNTAPKFSNATFNYSVGRNSQPGTVLSGLLLATDRESDALNYTIGAQAVAGMFVVNVATGVVSVGGFSTLIESPTVLWLVLTATGACDSVTVR